MAVNHVGIILDGNRRFAKKKGLNPLKGHDEGVKRVEDVINESLELSIKNLTLYIFSTENFNRNKVEVEFLMNLFKRAFKKLEEDENFLKKGVRIRFVGNKNLFPKDIQDIMDSIENKTKQNDKLTVNFAMAYGGREEILHAVKKIVENKVSKEDVDEKLFSDNLYVKEDVDLIIRTSGEKRLSSFLPWQGVYAELMFVEKLWPEFTKEDFRSCIKEFEQINRRFGQ